MNPEQERGLIGHLVLEMSEAQDLADYYRALLDGQAISAECSEALIIALRRPDGFSLAHIGEIIAKEAEYLKKVARYKEQLNRLGAKL